MEKELVSLKQELKCWESMFSRKYGKKPSKQDVDEAPCEVRESYKRYAQLKKALTSSAGSSSNQCNDENTAATLTNAEEKENLLAKPLLKEEVFGKSLNKPTTPIIDKKLHLKNSDGLSTYKKPSLSRLKRSTDSPLQIKVSPEEKKEKAFESGVLLPDIKISSCVSSPDIGCKPSSNIHHGKKKSRWSSLTTEWLEVNKESCKTEKEDFKVDNSKSKSEEVMHTSEDHPPTLQSDQKEAVSSSTENKSTKVSAIHQTQSNTKFITLPSKEIDIDNMENHDEYSSTNAQVSKPLECNENESSTEVSAQIVIRKNNKSKVLTSKEDFSQNETIDMKPEFNEQKDSPVIKKKRKARTVKSKEESDMDYRPDEIDVKPKRRGRVPKTASIDVNDGEEVDNDSASVETDKDTKSKASKRQLDGDEKQRSESVAKRSKKTVTLSKKKLVSDNFVKIDMRKKTYQRGVKKMTGARYKRQEWRKKSSFDGSQPQKWKPGMGKKICFKCGEEGHWAKFCRGPKKKVDPFTKLDAAKNSIESEHLDELSIAYGSTSNEVECDRPTVFGSCSNFTMHDVLDIQPINPRPPYDSPVIEDGIALPLFNQESGKPPEEAYIEVRSALQMFGYNSFRSGQEEAVSRIVSGLSTMLIMSTGAGKSLCYQLPAYMYYKKYKYLTLVVSPLVALMEDQIANLPKCLKGAFLNSSMTDLQKQKVSKKLINNEIAVLLVSPEALVSGGFGTGILPPKSKLPTIAFACIDEAHCLSEWSHNFRPSYLRVCRVLQERYNVKCLLGLTATASLVTAQSVTDHLNIGDPASIIRDPHPIPENLILSASRDSNRDKALVELLQMQPFADCRSIIIYCTRRTEVERIASMLRTSLPDDFSLPPEEEETSSKRKSKTAGSSKVKPDWWIVECYHAGLTPAQRRRAQKAFMMNKLRIIVATIAFGMGLDKSDVRSVIHYNMPKSFENYVQEIGRAGRDGLPSYCHVFIDDELNDLNELRRHVYANSVDRKTVSDFVDLLLPYCDCSDQQKSSVDSDNSRKKEDFDIDSIMNNESLDDIDMAMTQIDEKSFQVNSSSLVGSEEVELSQCSNTNDCLPAQYCSGHRVSFSCEQTVQNLDLKEEDLSTMLAYLENHENRWIRVLNEIRQTCSIKCYGGPLQFQKLCKMFHPLAAAVRFQCSKKTQENIEKLLELEFNVVKVADKMCWDLWSVIRDLRSLQWNMTFALDAELNTSGKSGIIVEFSDRSFHVITTSNIGDTERDEICDYLHEASMEQEETRLLQLESLYGALCDLSTQFYWQFNQGKRGDTVFKEFINQYFTCDKKTQKEALKSKCKDTVNTEISASLTNSIASDVRGVFVSYPDAPFTGRSIARILQGIDSPAFPAVAFGRDRRFWRKHLDVDFNVLRKIATSELRQLRR